ncbi:MAG: glycosyltransferase family 2 protein, partial [Ignavibacteriaceae bacterium]|nr:glycosyltransferase family 2 protein [Ignavibacteriaceae bacterium]
MISVICPALNESVHIEKVLNFFVNANPIDKELLIIDGGSTDGTREIVNEWAKKYSNIRLLENPDKYVPFALNIAIKNSTGNPIIRIDAHSDYAPDYFEKILETFESTGADIVGGPYLTKAVTPIQAAVANAISNPFGIGNSKAHNPDFKGYVDSVPYGAWKRELFEQTGYFDERFKRNQDDEFHYRAKSLGKKIFLNPEIKLWYYPRNSLYSLFRQYYEYGLYKPLVLKKIKSEIKFRHIVPALFMIYLILLPLSFLSLYYLLPLLFYLITDLAVSFASRGGLKTK